MPPYPINKLVLLIRISYGARDFSFQILRCGIYGYHGPSRRLGVVRQPTITLLVIALVRRSVQRSPSLLTPVMEQFTIQTPADLFTYLAPSTINFQFPVELLIEIVILLSTLLHPRSANPLSYLSGDQNLWHSFCL